MRWLRPKTVEAENFVICVYFLVPRSTTTPKFDSAEHLFPYQCFQFVYWMALICTLIEQISGNAQCVASLSLSLPPPSIHIEPLSNILAFSVFVDQTACQLTAILLFSTLSKRATTLNELILMPAFGRNGNNSKIP